jgi:DNA-directed RNA polymerase subunit beta
VDKKLFSRVFKDRKAKTKEKIILEKLDDEFNAEVTELRAKLVDKLIVLVSGKTSQGVMNSLKEVVVSKGYQIYPEDPPQPRLCQHQPQ